MHVYTRASHVCCVEVPLQTLLSISFSVNDKKIRFRIPFSSQIKLGARLNTAVRNRTYSGNC